MRVCLYPLVCCLCERYLSKCEKVYVDVSVYVELFCVCVK